MQQGSEPNRRPKRSLRGQAVSGFFWTLSGTGAKSVTRIVVLAVLARLLTPEDFGLMSAALVVVGFSALFSQLGVGPALVQRQELTSAHIRVGLTSSIGFGLTLAVAVALSAPLIASFFGFEELTLVLRVLALQFPLMGLSTVGRSLMQREMRFRTLAAIEVLSYLVGYALLATILGAIGLGVWALVFGHLAQASFTVIAVVVIERRHMRPGFDIQSFKDLATYGGGFTIARVFNYIGSQGDNIVAGRFLGASALGLYSRAFQIVVFPVNQVNLVIDQVLFPMMARIQTSADRLTRAFRRGVTLMAITFVPIAVTVAILSREVVLVALGTQWREAIDPLRVLAFGMIFRSGYQVSDTLARATGAVYRRAARQFVYASAVLLGAWIGQHWGLTGLAWGVFGALFVNFYLMTSLSLSLTEMTWRSFARAYVPASTFGGIALLVGLPAAVGFREADLSPLAILLLVGGIVVLTILMTMRLAPQMIGTDREWMSGVLAELLLDRLPRWARFRRPRGSDVEPPETDEGES